jgi:peptide/nickel transport system permease protein
MAHPLGTTVVGRDVLSQLIFGTRTTLLVGLAAGLTSVTLGTTIGIVTGYLGGYVDDVLMRLTDLAYGIPFLPFALALVFILGASLVNIIVAISLIMWRSTARVVRAQTLTVKEQPYIESAEAAGVGHLRMMARHVLPNVFPIVVLYTALTMGWSILAEANLAFLGFGDPLRVSWGTMIFGTYSQDVIRTALWWVIPPGICIMLIVMAVFFIGRALEEYINPELKEA